LQLRAGFCKGVEAGDEDCHFALQMNTHKCNPKAAKTYQKYFLLPKFRTSTTHPTARCRWLGCGKLAKDIW